MSCRIALSSHSLAKCSVREALDAVSKDFHAWEIVGEGGHHLPSIESELNELLPSYDIECSVHTPLSDVNIGSLNPRMREAAMSEVISAIECTGRLGMNPFTLHPGFYTPLGMTDKEAAQAVTRGSIKTIDKVAKDNGVIVALENMPDMPISMITTPEEMASSIEGTEIKICLDLGHANTTGNIESYLELKELIANIHIHDNNGKYDQHLTIGNGNIDFKSFMPKLRFYKGRYVIEARTLDGVPLSRSRLEALLSR
ncbi:MAG: sugar phosphate isomerase/epimerase [Euryarchaeota archaeon]|nr:sugar phosphate isomerase/epimerase [Euryarchaeota archaeon]